MNDVMEDTFVLDKMMDVPHCETAHGTEGREWTGDCTHTVVATMTVTCRNIVGQVCLNTVIGYQDAKSLFCNGCFRETSKCWVITPL